MIVQSAFDEYNGSNHPPSMRPPIEIPARRPIPGKRALDLGLALPAALVTSPLVVVLIAGSSMRFRRLGLFKQPRLGLLGREFLFRKVRTLSPTVDPAMHKYQLRHVRITHVGRVMRAWHLDELPQLWHVLSGSMSLVGPRPEMPSLSSTYDPNFVAERLSVKPGCTGLWQISVASSGLIGEAEEWDRHYVAHATLRLDLWILYRTVRVLLTRNTLKSLDEIPRWTGAATGSTR